MTVSVLEVGHQGEPLPLHAVTAGPQARDVVRAEGTVDGDGVVLHLLRRLVRHHAALPLAQEGLARVDLDPL